MFTAKKAMEHNSSDHKLSQNKLWIVRKRAGYLQKWVAAMLGQRVPAMVSAYERGTKMPSFETAIKLELVYQTPLSELFPNLYSELARDVEKARRNHAPVLKRDEEVSVALTNLAKVGLLTPAVASPMRRSTTDSC